MAKQGVLIVGSANMDMVVRTGHFPKPGETVLGSSFDMFPGGKGANQAVCVAKLGGPSYFLGKMGDDMFAQRLQKTMESDGVDLNGLLNAKDVSTGVASITIDGDGENEIVVVPGSNSELTPENIQEHSGLFERVNVLLAQLEIPMGTVEEAFRVAKKSGLTTVLNPAPAQQLPTSLFPDIDILTPNETELEYLSGNEITGIDDAINAARSVLAKGVNQIIVTVGENGAVLVEADRTRHIPGIKVEVVDSTAAGDAFNGALAFGLSREMSLDKSVDFANRVASQSVTRMGAQTSMPTLAEVEYRGLDFVNN
ncbi:MAG: ribokinase [Candidatus Marinimicrobia bacterium]|nr:ribokinase [Candidatus Neomarinimicrobiota bacterium]